MSSPAHRADTFSRGLALHGWDGAVEYVGRNGPRLAAWALPFVLTVYLGLKGGGYDTIIRSEVGIVVWWVVLLGAVVGILPSFRLGRAGWIGLGLLVAFAAWTTIGIAWSASSERSMLEVGRVATYLGVFALTLSMRRPGSLRLSVNGLAAGIAVIGLFALLSRLHPSAFPTDETAQFLTSRQKRLSYPLNYWNGLAALMAIGVPLLLAIAIRARTIVGGAISASAIPVLALTAFFTLSRGGAIEVAVGLIVFFALAPRRLTVLPTALAAGAGSAILIAAASQRNELTDGLGNAAAHQQGNEMLAVAIIVCGGVGVLQVAIGLAQRHQLVPAVNVPRRRALAATATAVLVAIVVAVGAGVPRELSDQWNEFKDPAGAGAGVNRFESSSGGGRYQTWDAAVQANHTDPLIGIGPGTYEYWWAEHGTIPVFARDAHSLYIETLGELGLIGFLLIVGFVGTVLVTGAKRSLGGDPGRRWAYAAATAGVATFAVAAGIDWAWELPVVPIGFMALAGSILAPRRYKGESPARRNATRTRRRLRSSKSKRIEIGIPQTRAILAGLGVVSMILILIPLRGTDAMRTSENRARSGDLQGALAAARTAHDRQPYAASPLLQEALILELMHNYNGAAGFARDATAAESTNWRTWLVLSRLEAERGDAVASVNAYRRARALNPRSILFVQSQQPEAQ